MLVVGEHIFRQISVHRNKDTADCSSSIISIFVHKNLCYTRVMLFEGVWLLCL